MQKEEQQKMPGGETAAEADKLISDLLEDIRNNKLKLPVLPDVAIKIYRMLDDSRSSLSQIAKLVGIDAAITARLIQVANSPIYRGNVPVDDAFKAVSRLGLSMVRTLVTVMLVELMHHPKSATLRQRASKLWRHNATVAAISFVLAKRFTALSPEEAMLAGLLHDIGVLPILERASRVPSLINNTRLLDEIISEHHAQIGKVILESWNFPPELVQVAAEHEHLEYRSELLPELVDVVIVANLHSYLGTDHPCTRINWDDIPAFSTLGLTPQQSIEVIKEAKEEIREMRNLLTSS